MCRRVILNDWGSARNTGVAGFSKKHAVAVDTAQVIELVRHALRHLLDFLPLDELNDAASEGAAAWWKQTAARLTQVSSELHGLRAELTEGRRPQLYLLGVLGLVSMTEAAAAPAARAGSKRPRESASSAAAPAEPIADEGSSVDVLLAAATSATGCSCYTSDSTPRVFDVLPTAAVVASPVAACDDRHSAGLEVLRATAPAEEISEPRVPELEAVASSSAPAPECFSSAERCVALEVSDVAVLVSNFADFFDESTLCGLMAKFGAVDACKLLPTDVAINPGRIALVQYSDARVAARVVAHLTSFIVGGLLLGVAAAPAALVACYFGRGRLVAEVTAALPDHSSSGVDPLAYHERRPGLS